jgi:hypothetical protein
MSFIYIVDDKEVLSLEEDEIYYAWMTGIFLRPDVEHILWNDETSSMEYFFEGIGLDPSDTTLKVYDEAKKFFEELKT